MITFKATIKKDKLRADKTWNVIIRVIHKRKIRYIPTSMYVTKKDVTTSFKIKNQQVLDRCDDIIRVYRQRVNELELEFNDISIDTIVEYITAKKDSHDINFTAFAEKWCNQHTEIKGIRNYRSAINAFKMFFGRENILCMEITAKSMKAFENALEDRPRAQSSYTSMIVRLFNEAKEYYNDEDNNIIRIKHSLSKYRPPKQNVAKKRALDIETIRAIYNLPYNNIKVRGHNSRHDLAKDCFLLSFCLMGMNTADLFNATEYDGEYITYERTKTKDRRTDNALMRVAIPNIIKPIFERYRGKERVFNFHERFSTYADLNRAVNIGLKEIGTEVNEVGLQFYAARHSMATIAVNDCRINKYIVNDMLCHIDTSMRITDLYIKKDFSAINDANKQLMKYVFNGIVHK